MSVHHHHIQRIQKIKIINYILVVHLMDLKDILVMQILWCNYNHLVYQLKEQQQNKLCKKSNELQVGLQKFRSGIIQPELFNELLGSKCAE